MCDVTQVEKLLCESLWSEGGEVGEGRVVGVPKFHSWDKCTMTLTNINSDWMSNASSGLRIINSHLGCNGLPQNVNSCVVLPYEL